MISRRKFLIAGMAASTVAANTSDLFALRSVLLSKSHPPIAGAQMWLKRGCGLFTDAGITPATSPGDLIYQWNDQSGNGYHATQSTEGLRPKLASDGSLYFQGFVPGGATQDQRQMALSGLLSVNSRAFTLFVVSQLNANSYQCGLFQSTNLNPGLLSNENTGGPGWGNFCLWGSALQQSGFKQTCSKNVQTMVGGSSNSQLHLNNDIATKTTLPAATNTGGKLGNWNDFRWWIGTISEVLLYSSELSTSQVSETKSWLYARHGILSASSSSQVVFDGDSLTFGYLVDDAKTYPVQVFKSLPAGWRILNYSKPGNRITDMNSTSGAVVDSVFAAGYTKNICVGWGGCNDLNAGVSPATAFSNYQNYGNARKAAGFEFVACTLLPRASSSGTYESDRQDFNTLVRGDTSFYDALADFGQNAIIGQSGQNTNNTYYQSDNIHLNAIGAGIVASLVKNAINTL